MTTTQTATIIDTPEGMAHFAMCQCIGRLRIEVSTGMKFRQSTLAAVQHAYGIKGRTKRAALKELQALYAETYGREYAPDSDPLKK